MTHCWCPLMQYNTGVSHHHRRYLRHTLTCRHRDGKPFWPQLVKSHLHPRIGLRMPFPRSHLLHTISFKITFYIKLLLSQANKNLLVSSINSLFLKFLFPLYLNSFMTFLLLHIRAKRKHPLKLASSTFGSQWGETSLPILTIVTRAPLSRKPFRPPSPCLADPHP